MLITYAKKPIKSSDKVVKLYGARQALARLSNYIDKDKLRLIMKAFITSQFSYCPLVWMFHSRGLNKRINKIHEKSLRLVYNDNISSFDELLVKDNCVTIHDRNLQVLATEIFKAINDISPTIMKNIFDVKRTTYNLRSGPTLLTSNIKTVKYGMESLSYRLDKTWNLVPLSIRNSKTLSEFKSRIKVWKPVGCDCKLCKTYIPNLGFL